mmetsp:Transcript_46274/g.83401  ORF Transcript_46274/g.83401 Transcript_46274/m.83401 type:complete len:102 (-) Transcript_46274:1617-1922(-)
MGANPLGKEIDMLHLARCDLPMAMPAIEAAGQHLESRLEVSAQAAAVVARSDLLAAVAHDFVGRTAVVAWAVAAAPSAVVPSWVPLDQLQPEHDSAFERPV